MQSIFGLILLVAASIATAAVLPEPALTIATNATASTVAVEPDGKLVIGGNFEFANGEKRRNLARFTPEGVLDPSFKLEGFANGPITSLVVAGDFLYVGGSFTSIGGKPRINVARIVRATGSVDEWTLEGRNDPGKITQMLLDGNDLYIAGVFGFDGLYVNFTTIAKINAITGKRDGSFAPSILPILWPSGDEVDAIAISNGWLYVGGYLSTVDRMSMGDLVRVDAKTGRVDPNWAPDPYGGIVGIVVNGDDVYVAGSFEKFGNTVPRKYLAKLDARGKVDTAFQPELDAPPTSLTMVNGRLRVLGPFKRVNGALAAGIAELALDTGATVKVNPADFDGTPQATAEWGGTTVVVGDLKNVAGTLSSGIALLDPATFRPDKTRRMTVTSTGSVVTMAKTASGSIFIGGSFTEINGVPRGNLALLDPDGSLNMQWTAGVNGIVYSLLVTDVALYAGGVFTVSASTPLSNLARFRLATQAVEPTLVPRLDNAPSGLVAQAGMVYAGGYFGKANDLPFPQLLRFSEATGAVDLNWNPAPNGIVLGLALSADALFVGGRFSVISGSARKEVAKFKLSSGLLDLAFDARLDNGTVYSLLVSGDALFATGQLTPAGDPGVIRLRTDTGAAVAAFKPPTKLLGSALAMSNGVLYVGGGHQVIGADAERILVKLDPATGALDSSFPDVTRGSGIGYASGGWVSSILPGLDRIFVAGGFDRFGGEARANIAAWGDLTPKVVTVREFYSPALRHYFRTADVDEATALTSNPSGGFVATGDDFKAWSRADRPAGARIVYRFYGSITPGPNSHFYTADADEYAAVAALQYGRPNTQPRWNFEATAFAVDVPMPSGACPARSPVPVFRAYNNRATEGDSNHRFTTLQSEYKRLMAEGWKGEGIVMCGTAGARSS